MPLTAPPVSNSNRRCASPIFTGTSMKPFGPTTVSMLVYCFSGPHSAAKAGTAVAQQIAVIESDFPKPCMYPSAGWNGGEIYSVFRNRVAWMGFTASPPFVAPTSPRDIGVTPSSTTGRGIKWLFPNGFAGAGEPEAGPFFAHGADDLLAHTDFASP